MIYQYIWLLFSEVLSVLFRNVPSVEEKTGANENGNKKRTLSEKIVLI